MDEQGVTGVGSVQLSVNDIDECRAFYEEIIGLEVRDRSGPLVLGSSERPIVRLRETDQPQRLSAAAGLYHLAIRVPGRASLGAVLERVSEAGVLEGTADHGVSEAIYLSDPEGNGVEIYRDRAREDWPRSDGGIDMLTEPLDVEAVRDGAAAADTVPATTDLGHVHLEVTDLDEARQFFGETLGFPVQAAYGSSALFLGAGGYHHHIGLNIWKLRDRPVSGRGLDWFTVCCSSAPVCDTIIERCRDAGYNVDDDERLVTGPDDIQVNLIWDT